MEKVFKSINEQIEILKSKNLKIKDNKIARDILSNNNYYYLINGYKDLFIKKENRSEQFKNNINLEEIYNLYEFDRKIRIIFLEYILLIERRIDTYIAYEFSKKYGVKNYLVHQNFYSIEKNKNLINNFISNIKLEISYQYKNNNKMIVDYIDKYGYVPLWVLIRFLSFGKVSKFYSFMKREEQKVISKKFNIKSNTLRIYLTNLGEVRNICAHDEKLYDIRLRFKISANTYHSKLDIKDLNGNYLNGVNDLFSIVLILKGLLNKYEFKQFYKSLIKNIAKLKRKINLDCFEEILHKMGFPKRYKKLLKL